MKTVYSILLLFLITGLIQAQSVAINSDGSAPNANAILDISSTTKGVLLPRMTTAQRIAIGNVAGMVVFDTDLSDIHHNTGSAWTKALTTNNIANITWITTGNAGTNSSTNFLGTTDAVSLIFKTDNTERLQINSVGEIGAGTAPVSNTRLTVNNTTNNTSTSTIVKGQTTQINMEAAANADSVILINTQFSYNNTGGTIEDFIGIKVGDISGSGPSFRNSGTITNTYGVFIGDITDGTQTNKYAMYSTDANAKSYYAGPMGLGTQTPRNQLDVEGGVAIGATYSGSSPAPPNGLIVEGSVGIGTNGTRSTLDVEGGVAIGASYSGSSPAPTNGLIVEGNAGFGTNNPTSTLHISGSFKFEDGSAGDDYKVLQFDPAGNASWQRPGNLRYDITTVTANYTATADDYLIVGNPSVGNIIIEMPLLAANSGQIIKVFNKSGTGHNITINCNTFDGGCAIKGNNLLTPLKSAEYFSDGSGVWYQLSGN